MTFQSERQRRAAYAKGHKGRKGTKTRRAPLSAIKPGTVLHQTDPHGEHKILLVEDQADVADRIYEIQGHKECLGILGSELDSLAAWWAKERRRPGKEAPEPVPEGEARWAGYEDARHQIRFVVSQGGTIQEGIKAHQEYRKVGDLFTDDAAGFHRGARDAYQEARQHPERFRGKGGKGVTFKSSAERRAAYAKKTIPSSKPGTRPLLRGRNYGASNQDAVFQLCASLLADALLEYLPDQISSAGVVSLDAWSENAADTLVAAHKNGELPEDGESYLARHDARLKAAVTKELRQRGIQVVPRRQDALRLLADTQQLRSDQLPAFQAVILEEHASREMALEAELHGNQAYTVLVDGTLRAGVMDGERYVVVRG